LFQAWESAEAFAAHIDFPAHKQMLVGGKPWKSRNVVIRRWDDARGFQNVTLDGSEKRAGLPVRPEGRPAEGSAVTAEANSTGVNVGAMVVQYATMEIDAPDLDAYEQWHSPIVAACRQEAGCLTYEAGIDPSDPTRRALFQAWESLDAFVTHRAFAHDELKIERTPWESRNVVIWRWDDARDYHEVTLDEARARIGIKAD
jgi:quinol monooxygenase YgiN